MARRMKSAEVRGADMIQAWRDALEFATLGGKNVEKSAPGEERWFHSAELEDVDSCKNANWR